MLIFAGGSFTPEIDVPGRPIPNQRGAHPDASIFGSKGSWMLWAQMAQFSAQARVILPSLYAPFGLPQPTVTVVDTDLVIKGPTSRGFPGSRQLPPEQFSRAPALPVDAPFPSLPPQPQHGAVRPLY